MFMGTSFVNFRKNPFLIGYYVSFGNIYVHNVSNKRFMLKDPANSMLFEKLMIISLVMIPNTLTLREVKNTQ